MQGFRQEASAGLFRSAVFAAGVGDARYSPLAVGADEIEEIGAAMVDFAVCEEFDEDMSHAFDSSLSR